MAAPGSLHFRPEMRLEAKNRLQSGVVGVATIDRIADGKLLIHFDGWNSKFDFWCSPNSTDIHPAMWTGKHSMKVEPPRGQLHVCKKEGERERERERERKRKTKRRSRNGRRQTVSKEKIEQDTERENKKFREF